MTASSDVKFEIGHVLFIDIVGYSKLLINEQSEQIQQLKAIVRGTEQVRLAEAEGKLLRLPTGDGGALVFRNSPEAPVRCALEIGKELKKHPELRVRMGVHSGPVNEVVDLNEQANIAGAGINIAQRVMDCGDAGHILLSKRVADDLEQYPRWRPCLDDLGECEVKHGVRLSIFNLYSDDIGNPAVPAKVAAAAARRRSRAWRIAALAVAATVMAIAAVLLLGRLGKTTKPGLEANAISERSIAVLPFVDLSQAKDQEYFCDGISEEILDRLAKIEGLRVVARTSSFWFKGKNIDVSEIAQKLGVRNILEGSLRRDGNQIRISAQLINAKDGYHIWSDTFERELKGVFVVQDEITQAIVDALKIKLSVAPSPRPIQNTEAYDLYLQGLFFSNKSDEANLRKSIGLFQQGIEKDPTLGRAWTGIAKAWLYLADAYVRPLEAYPALRAAALKALAINPQDAEAHAYLGETLRVLDWDLEGGNREQRRAIEIDPNLASAHEQLGIALLQEGERTRGLDEIQQAAKLDPVSADISDVLCWAYTILNKLDEAIAQGKHTLELDPNWVYLDSFFATAYREKGKFEEAIAIYSLSEQETHSPSSGLAITFARMGRTADAQQKLAELLKQRERVYIASDVIAKVYAALGQKDEAFTWLERAYEEHAANLQWIAVLPEFKSLRSDPRFIDLVKRIGLDPAKAIPH